MTKLSTGLRGKIETLVSEISSDLDHLEHRKIQLGVALAEVQDLESWRDWGFKTFGAYIDSLKDRVEKGRTQLYGYMGVAKYLLPYVAPHELEKMGISRAMILKSAVKNSGTPPSQKLLTIATKESVEKVKAAVAEEYHIRTETEQGEWMDLPGFYATIEEKAEIERCFSVAERTDPVISKELHDSVRTKEIILRLVREYLATYENAVEKGEG